MSTKRPVPVPGGFPRTIFVNDDCSTENYTNKSNCTDNEYAGHIATYELKLVESTGREPQLKKVWPPAPRKTKKKK